MAIPNWVTLSQNQGGTGTTIVSITAQTYSELVQRVGALTVNTDNAGLSATVSLVQEAREVVNVSVSPSYINVPQTGGTYVFNVVSNGDWNITSYPDWCTLSTTSGTGNQAVTVTVAENVFLYNLFDEIVIETTDNSASIMLTQEQLTPYLNVVPENIHFTYTGGSENVYIESNYMWTVTGPEWINISDIIGNENKTIVITSDVNIEDYTLDGEIVITCNDIIKRIPVVVDAYGGTDYERYSYIPFTIEAETSGTCSVSGSVSGSPIYHKLNNGDWVQASKTINLNIGDKLSFRSSIGTDGDRYGFQIYNFTGNYKTYGNIYSLYEIDNYKYPTVDKPLKNLMSFFSGKTVTDAKNLVIPFTSIACEGGRYGLGGCDSMFADSKLKYPPKILPATTLSMGGIYGNSTIRGCYYNMFYRCWNLLEVPELPATTLGSHCYEGMFSYCNKITTAPALPATTLEESCYSNMFYRCTSLVNVPTLSATTLANGCFLAMFRYCTSLVNAPELPNTPLKTNCYRYMFANCSSLVQAPEIKQTTSVDAMDYMFDGCSSLNYINCWIQNPNTGHTNNWVQNVASTGTFVAKTNTWTIGNSGIPTTWIIVYEYFTIDKNSITINEKMEEDSFTITVSNNQLTYTITAPDWVTLSQYSGNSSATITVNANSIADSLRTGIISITDSNGITKTITITQNKTLLLSITEYSTIRSLGGTVLLEVYSPFSAYTLTSSSNEITVNPMSGGITTGDTITVTIPRRINFESDIDYYITATTTNGTSAVARITQTKSDGAVRIQNGAYFVITDVIADSYKTVIGDMYLSPSSGSGYTNTNLISAIGNDYYFSVKANGKQLGFTVYKGSTLTFNEATEWQMKGFMAGRTSSTNQSTGRIPRFMLFCAERGEYIYKEIAEGGNWSTGIPFKIGGSGVPINIKRIGISYNAGYGSVSQIHNLIPYYNQNEDKWGLKCTITNDIYYPINGTAEYVEE